MKASGLRYIFWYVTKAGCTEELPSTFPHPHAQQGPWDLQPHSWADQGPKKMSLSCLRIAWCLRDHSELWSYAHRPPTQRDRAATYSRLSFSTRPGICGPCHRVKQAHSPLLLLCPCALRPLWSHSATWQMSLSRCGLHEWTEHSWPPTCSQHRNATLYHHLPASSQNAYVTESCPSFKPWLTGLLL